MDTTKFTTIDDFAKDEARKAGHVVDQNDASIYANGFMNGYSQGGEHKEADMERRYKTVANWPFFQTPSGKWFYCYKDTEGYNKHSEVYETEDLAFQSYSRLTMNVDAEDDMHVSVIIERYKRAYFWKHGEVIGVQRLDSEDVAFMTSKGTIKTPIDSLETLTDGMQRNPRQPILIKNKLRVVHSPQIGKGLPSFYLDVIDEYEAHRMTEVLSYQHLFLQENNFIPDYANNFAVHMWSEDSDGKGTPGWEDYYNEYEELAWDEFCDTFLPSQTIMAVDKS